MDIKIKKTFFSLLLLASILSPLSGKNRVIDNPAYEVKYSGIYNIVKIELSETETRIHVKTTFIPGWWVKFPTTTFIQPEGSTEKILATGIEKGEFDKGISMPASGDSLFVLIFPPLDKTIKKIDYGEADRAIYFGVSLEKGKSNSNKVQNGIPTEVESWINTELEKADVKTTLPDFKSDNFFNRQPARLIGYIKGYDPRLGFSTGIIYKVNTITLEDFPITIYIHTDGRFESVIPMEHPAYMNAFFSERPINFYIEPGHSLAMILDWEEFLIADRQRNIIYKFKDIQYKGALEDINRKLLAANLKEVDWNERGEKIKTLSPDEYKAYEMDILLENREYIHQHISNEKVKTLLNNNVLLTYGISMLIYIDKYMQRLRENPENHSPLPIGYYNFLQQIPMNDQSLLCDYNSHSFINRFKFCKPFMSITNTLTFHTKEEIVQFIKNERSDNWTQDDDHLVGIWLKYFQITDNEKSAQYYEENKATLETFQKKFEAQLNKFSQIDFRDRVLKEKILRDSILTDVLELPMPNLLYDIVKVYDLDFSFNSVFLGAEDSYSYLLGLNKSIQHPFLIAEATRIYEKIFPMDEVTTYDLPDTELGELFREMIAPLKGKYIAVDFWESTCGPCIFGIKKNKGFRDKMKGSKDIAFLFICSEETPFAFYNKYVEEQDFENSYRLTKDQYNRMRELFKFNGIPHYEYIDREGRIMTKGLEIDNLDETLKSLLEKETQTTIVGL